VGSGGRAGLVTRRLLVSATALVALLPTACGQTDGSGSWHRPEHAGGTAALSVSRPKLPDPVLSAPPEARNATALATRLTTAERVSRDAHSPRSAAAQAGFEAQALYRQLARRPGWLRPVVHAVPPRLRRTVRLHVRARRAFRAMHAQLSRTLPAWRIVAPAPEPQLLSFYREGERRFGVPWQVLAAVNLVETGMGRIRGTSVAGARGPMQFMPATWAAYGRGDIDDPHDAILAAARYLAHNGGGRGRVAEALFAYNHSSRYVQGVQAYAAVLHADPAALRGLYDWQVVYLSRRGHLWLPEGYVRQSPIGASAYLRRHPERLLSRSTR
jgi:membrane-bound lytic murein transglycosylase B